MSNKTALILCTVAAIASTVLFVNQFENMQKRSCELADMEWYEGKCYK